MSWWTTPAAAAVTQKWPTAASRAGWRRASTPSQLWRIRKCDILRTAHTEDSSLDFYACTPLIKSGETLCTSFICTRTMYSRWQRVKEKLETMTTGTHIESFFLTLAHYFRIAWFVYLLSSDEPKINVPIFKISQPWNSLGRTNILVWECEQISKYWLDFLISKVTKVNSPAVNYS